MKQSLKERVYKITASIPKGYVATYGQIARLAGSPKSSRAVGFYMKTNTNPPLIPCHRVVSKNGSMTGYSLSGGISKKRKLLIEEGVSFKNDRVDLTLSQWSP